MAADLILSLSWRWKIFHKSERSSRSLGRVLSDFASWILAKAISALFIHSSPAK